MSTLPIIGTGRVEAAEAAKAAKAASPPSSPKDAKRLKELEVAAREFEQIFVRSMLKGTPLAAKGDAYGDLAVDAMAKSVTSGRGLGLAELIRKTVEKSEFHLKVSK
jgi:Rod binding domain-containing protein